MLKLAIDIHGVIDTNPDYFSKFTKRWIESSEIHIITGGTGYTNIPLLKRWNISYSYFFSITDYHRVLGTPMQPGRCDGEICIEDNLWDETKGIYCKNNYIDILIDDTIRYAKYLPEYTKFIHFTKNNT